MAGKIAQIVDSAGNLPREVLDKFKIREVPLYFTFDNQNYYRENTDMSNTNFYLHMKEKPRQVPKTSAPNVHDWISVFTERYQQGFRNFIVTTIASQLSASFQNAKLAKDMFLESRQDVRIEVIDPRTCACGQAALEIKIAKMINEKQLDFDELIKRTRDSVSEVTSLFSVKELTYMKAGGRIGGATAFLGNLINIKPICEFINGAVHPVKAVRGRKKALQSMVNICAGRLQNAKNSIIVTQHALCEEDELYIIECLKQKFGKEVEIYRSRVGTSVGSHSGPGAIGIGYVKL